MDRENVPAKLRQTRLGHSHFDMTMRYTHIVGEDDRKIAGFLGDQLKPLTDKVQ